ncbi:hypothetical protein ABZX40_37455 [Streptomyces sp. NPDC004610]
MIRYGPALALGSIAPAGGSVSLRAVVRDRDRDGNEVARTIVDAYRPV